MWYAVFLTFITLTSVTSIKFSIFYINMFVLTFLTFTFISLLFSEENLSALNWNTIRCKKCCERAGRQTTLTSINGDTDAVLFDNRIVIQNKFNCKFFISSLLRSPLFYFLKTRILL